MSTHSDVIVVGSGASGAHAAQTLVEAGCSVTMLDAGSEPPACASSIPDCPFDELRRSDPQQHAYFLGAEFEGVPLTRLGSAPQVTPPRQHVVQTLPGHPAVVAAGFAAIESHALGGLASGWGAVSFPYSDVELLRSGLDPVDMRPHYERIARRIGISGDRDDLERVRGPLRDLQPALPADHNATALLARYERARGGFHARRLFVGRPLLAALSEDRDGRRANPLHDMDFWSNTGNSVYRPDITIRRLRGEEGFRYEKGLLVERFAENQDDTVSVIAGLAEGGERRVFQARRLVLAAGALGTARIVLHSLGALDQKVPLACNAHLYVPCLHVRHLGRPHASRCHSLAQLTMIHDPTGDGARLVQAQMYSYRSLLLFRLLKEMPLPQREALRIAQALAPAIVIWTVEHEDEPSAASFCRLTGGRGGLPVLEVVSPLQRDKEQRRRREEVALMRGMRMLGAWPIRRVHSGHGSSLHYGGQFPSSSRDEPLTTDASGRLRGTRSVHVVDGAALRYLPAKGLTFTLMANADRVSTRIATDLRGG